MISFWHDQPEPVMPSEDEMADAGRILTEHLAQLNYRASVSRSLQNIRNGLSLLVFAVTAIGVIVLFKL